MNHSQKKFGRQLLLLQLLLLVLTASLPTQTLQAAATRDFLQALKPYAGAEAGAESNLFKISGDFRTVIDLDGELVDTVKVLSDEYWQAKAGLDGEFTASQQTFIVRGYVFRNFYDKYTDNDYTGADATVSWNWKIGRRWDGDLGYSYDRGLQNYANQSGFDATIPPSGAFVKNKNVRSRHNIFGRAELAVTNSWKTYVRAKYMDVGFSADTAQGDSLDTERRIVGGGIDYYSRTGNRAGVDVELVDGKYNDLSQLDFTEYNIKPTFNWEISEKSRVRGKVGYTSRNYDSNLEEDFDGFTGRLTLVRNPQEPTRFEAAIYREISTLNDDIANYAVIDGVSFTPIWEVGGKTTFALNADYEIRDFKGGNGLIPSNRQDKVLTGEIKVDWQANDFTVLTVTLAAENRNSNEPDQDYDYYLARAGIKVGF